MLVEAIDERSLPPVAGPEERAVGSPELTDALAELGPTEQEVMALRFGGDLPGPEIARILNLSLANVQQHSSRALRKLRARLEEPARPHVRA